MGVNGMASGAMTSLVKSLARQRDKDARLSILFELVGNDVCIGGVDSMTSVKDFRANILTSLTYLDAHLPVNSSVLTIGLADGSLLWTALKNRTHPIGVGYGAVYDFLNCLDISPCPGWMTSNDTARNITTTRAKELTGVYKEILSNSSVVFNNIKVDFAEFPLNYHQKWFSGQLWELIE
jgi:acyloxyacyl hydrolase